MKAPSDEVTSPGGTSGAKVVIVIIGALAIMTGLVIIAFTLFEPEGAPCAVGDLATNPLVNGQYQPRADFTNVEDAEAFICHGVPELTTGGWALERIQAERSLPTEFIVEGEGVGVVTLGYLQDASGNPLTIDAWPFTTEASYLASQLPTDRSEESVTVDGNPGTLYRFGINPNAVTLIWRDKTLEYRATATLTPDFGLPELVQVLETLE